jgi:hypothetical protein
LCRTDGFAELTSDAALLAGGVSAEGVLATEARADGSLLEGVVDLRRRRERCIDQAELKAELGAKKARTVIFVSKKYLRLMDMPRVSSERKRVCAL